MGRIKFFVLGALLLPAAQPSVFAQWKDFSSISETIKATDGRITQMRIDWSGSQRQIRVRLKGTLTFVDDQTAVAALSAGGRLSVEERKAGLYRKLEVRSTPDGALQYRYFVHAEPAIFGEIARRWFSALLLEIVREAGINSRQRAKALYARNGEKAILEEIARIDRERSKRFYYERLLEQQAVSDSVLHRIARQIRREFSADANLRIVISKMAARHPMSPATLLAVLDAVREINNEATRANVLTDVAAILPDNPAVLARYQKVANTIQSSVERQRALSASK